MQNIYPFFDAGEMDSARFFFGAEDPEVIIQAGSITLDEFLQEYESEQAFANLDNDTTPEGHRNITMTRIVVRIIKRYGNTDEADTMFLKDAEKCSPPLEDNELGRIWASAKKRELQLNAVMIHTCILQNASATVREDEYRRQYGKTI